jgi:hypothetical protein
MHAIRFFCKKRKRNRLVEKMRSAMLIGQKDESFFSLYPDKEKGIIHSLFPSMHQHLFLRGQVNFSTKPRITFLLLIFC